jgi:hypothetical protein
MPWYELVKVVHFLGFTALIGFFIIYSRAGPKLRVATDMKEVRTWLGLLAVAQPMVPGGAGMLTVSGLIMAWMRWRGPYPFMVVGFVVLAIVAATVTNVAGKHLRGMQAAATANDGPVSTDLSRIIREPRPWTVIFALNTAVLGVLIVMTTKLAWAWAIGIVVVLAALGAVIGSRLARAG